MTPGQLGEKKYCWQEQRDAVDHIVDALGKGIDDGIKELVTALRVHEFRTSQSCEGHAPLGIHGLPWPWVDIVVEAPSTYQRVRSRKKQDALDHEWFLGTLRERQRLTALLTEFYRNRHTPYDAIIGFSNLTGRGSFMIQSLGASIQYLWSDEDQCVNLARYREEMNAFAAFPKTTFFAEK